MNLVESGDEVPRNERKGLRVLAGLSLAAVWLALGGGAWDLYVLATRHLTTVHTISNVVALVTLGFGARAGVKYFGEARASLKAGGRRALGADHAARND